jgi:hypothetical protein
LEDVLVLVEMEYARRGKFLPYSSVRKEQYISLFQRGVLNAGVTGYTITTEGYQELRKIIGEEPLQLKSVVKTSDFEEFWNTFPVSDAQGNWVRTRTLKSNKTKCLELYSKALKNGVLHSTIIGALKWEIKDREIGSTTRNKMSFMKNSASWLFQREYEVIAEAMIEDTDKQGGDSWTEQTV